ncbi:MAG: hypothetical protein Q8R82_17120 [Hyphomonadaceae bacterium]|nr:hypothetical protein [Hyphomonadaceae bacterium]
MRTDNEAWAGAGALCDAGVLRAVRRAGYPPRMWKEEVDLELDFESPAGVVTFRVRTGPRGASDVRVELGVSLELSAGHLRKEDPDLFAEMLACWCLTAEPDAQWAIGSRLARPQRLEMTKPYVESVGFAFDCERDGAIIGRLMLFAEADVLFAVRDDHAEVAKYGLQTA